jgi:hypothetical protein
MQKSERIILANDAEDSPDRRRAAQQGHPALMLIPSLRQFGGVQEEHSSVLTRVASFIRRIVGTAAPLPVFDYIFSSSSIFYVEQSRPGRFSRICKGSQPMLERDSNPEQG